MDDSLKQKLGRCFTQSDRHYINFLKIKLTAQYGARK